MHTATATHQPTPSGFWMAVQCPSCAGPVRVTNPGCTNGRETKAIVRCDRHGDHLITCRITPTVERAGYVGPES
jgi:ribosomal protein S27E